MHEATSRHVHVHIRRAARTARRIIENVYKETRRVDGDRKTTRRRQADVTNKTGAQRKAETATLTTEYTTASTRR